MKTKHPIIEIIKNKITDLFKILQSIYCAMERNNRGISRTAIIKRRQKRIRQCRMLYPNDRFVDNLSVHHAHNQVDNISLPGHGTLHEPEQRSCKRIQQLDVSRI